MSDAIPAATLILFRDSDDGPPALLMVERARTMAFAAGAWVFPGGRIEPADAAFAARSAPSLDLDDAAARVAAIRETLEETGLLIGAPASFDGSVGLRTAVDSGRDFAGAAADAGMTLDLSTLVPFARWRPSHAPSRIFDTRFYLAPAPAEASVAVDGTENVRLVWTTAADMLARADRGDASLIYPTRRNLERLARFANHAAAIEDARVYPIRTISPFVEERNGVDHLCIPGDLGYPITAEPLARAVRG